MKQVKSMMLLVIAMVAFTITNAQKPKTESFKVWGNCSMCKSTIEKAAKSDAVSSAAWNKETKIFTVTFNPSKTNVVKIQKAIAASGYDTEKFKGDDKAYEKLPGCCHYDRKTTQEVNHSGHQH